MSHVTRILVTGGDGRLAHALRPYFPLADYHGRETCDVSNSGEVRNVFQDVRPELVIHCAAVTAHNAEPMAYVMGNVLGSIHVVAAARKHAARFIYLSTNHLGARCETDGVTPASPYAASKYAGELVARSLPTCLAIRGSWYSRLNYTHAATDAFSSAIPVDRAAYYVATLATSHFTGVVNIGGARRSIYEMALQFNENVTPISRRQLQLPYDLPEDCSLDTSKLQRWMSSIV